MGKQIHRMAIAAAGAALVALAPAAYAATSTVTATAKIIDRKPAGTNERTIRLLGPSERPVEESGHRHRQGGRCRCVPDGRLAGADGAIPSGSRYNNIEVLYGINLGGTTRDLAVLSDRGTDKLHIFAINGASATAPLSEVTASSAPLVFGGTKKINSKTTYGLAGWRNRATGKGEVFVTQENTTNLAKLVLIDAGGGKVSYQKRGVTEPAGPLHSSERFDVGTLLQPEAPRHGGARQGHGRRP